jgi:ferredoxin--NADP+ reductase
MPPDAFESLRARHYDAELIETVPVHDDLRIFRVRPDGGMPAFKAGQYVTLGLGLWEPRVPGVQEETVAPQDLEHVARRAYSVSCTLIDAAGRLVRVGDCPYLEFFIALVRQAEHPPVLTPRLFALEPGMRLMVGHRMVGHYGRDGVEADDQVVFFATGTGEAPHNAMLAELLHRGHTGRIVSVVSARWRRDLGYLKAHRELERRYSNYRFMAITTREPENLDPSQPGFVGKQYLQDYVASGSFERETGCVLDPLTTHVYLCGNPSMIGYHAPGESGHAGSDKPGMIQVLGPRGFVPDHGNHAGTIRLEKFW